LRRPALGQAFCGVGTVAAAQFSKAFRVAVLELGHREQIRIDGLVPIKRVLLAELLWGLETLWAPGFPRLVHDPLFP